MSVELAAKRRELEEKEKEANSKMNQMREESVKAA